MKRNEMTQEFAGLLSKYKHARFMYIGYLLLVILAAGLSILYNALGFVVVPLAILAYFLPVRKAVRAYTGAYMELGTLATLNHHLAQSAYCERNALDVEEIRNVHLIPASVKGGVRSYVGGSGLYKKREVSLGDVSLSSFFENQHTHKNDCWSVSGTWVRIKLPTDTGLDCRLLDCRLLPFPVVKELEIESGLTRLEDDLPQELTEKQWRVFTSDSLPDTAFLKALQAASDSLNRVLAVAIRGDEMHVFLFNRVLARKIELRVAPTPALQKVDWLPELPALLRLSDKLVKN